MKVKTNEQADVLKYVQQNKRIKLLKINSVAGSGKTTILVDIATLIKGKGLYLAFNKEIVKEAKVAFKGTKTEIATTNARAYKYVITKGLVDNYTARDVFTSIVKEYLPNYILLKAFKQRYISYNIKKLLPKTLDLRIIKDIEERFDTFIKNKRELDINFSTNLIKERIPEPDKKRLIHLLEEFCNSKYISIADFLKYKEEESYEKLMKQYFTKMVKKEIGVPFAFNLKYYHILLTLNMVNEPELDLLLLDEFSDSSEVILEILMLIPAKKRVVAGDTAQAITSFAYCVDGFKYYENTGETKHLSTSFRVSAKIAKDIEKFGKKHLKKSFKFNGFNKPVPEIETTAYLSRTNAGLIDTMIKLHDKKLEYKLTRPVKTIFSLIKTLAYISPKNPIYNKKYVFLENDIRDWNRSIRIRDKYKSLLNFIKFQHDENVELQSAIAIVYSKSRKSILDTLNKALEIEKNQKKKKDTVITLATTHSIKGLGFTNVYLNNDLEISDILSIPLEDRTLEEQETVNLLYVAMTRVTHNLYNAIHLN